MMNLFTTEKLAAIALGGNIGDTESTFSRACSLLASGGFKDLRMASIIVTKAVDCVPDTPDFHNTVAVGHWSGTPHELLNLCQSIERHLGRPASHSSHESRTVDLDIVLFEQRVISTPNLIVPHPRMRQRLFVLQPLAELAPNWPVPPDGKTVGRLLEEIMRGK